MLTLHDLSQLLDTHGADYNSAVRDFELRDRPFQFALRRYYMGVINLSHQSWYRESVCLSVESAVRRGLVLSAQGADVVDVGAESTLAHAAMVDDATQTALLLPVVRELAAHGVLVSVETYHRDVARSCFAAGAAVLNLTGNLEDDELYRIVADHAGAVILCYIQGRHVRDVGDFNFVADTVGAMHEYFAPLVERAERAGVTRIFIDPGLGFYYQNLQDSTLRIRHQMAVFLHTFRLRKLGWPTCHALPHAFELFRDEVRSAEPFFAVLAALGHTDLLRTHELPRTRAVVETLSLW